MKKIIFLLSIYLLAITNKSIAQAQQLKVINNTGCDVYYSIYGDYAPSCMPAYSSSIIVLSAVGTYYSDPTAVPIPPLGSTDFINGARVYSSLPGCSGFSSIAVGEPCSGLPATGTFYLFKADCSVCIDKLRTAKWVPATPPMFIATLIIN
jgi:hypothetical protein